MSRPMAAAFAALVSLHMSGAPATAAQAPKKAPLPQGDRIPAQHGDIIVVENDAQLLVVRRRDAVVRAVFNRGEQWLVLLADHAANGGPDGRVDWAYTYRELSGEWPLEDRWEGPTTIEEYVAIAQGPMSRGLGFASPVGLIQLLGGLPMEENVFRDRSAAAVLTYRGAGSGVGGRESFDQAEARQIANVRRSIQTGAQIQNSPGGAPSAGVHIGAAPPMPVDEGGPLRVGGTIRAPEKLIDVPPVLPETAARAGVRGVVILEVTVAVDGRVLGARVLRSIPLLDVAALEAVRQWRYAPTTVHGKPVPVVMTVAVPFQ